jgi:hypothetical protein
MASTNKTTIADQQRMAQQCDDLGSAQMEFLGKFADRIATLRVMFDNAASGPAVDRVAQGLNDCSRKVTAVIREIGEKFQEQSHLYGQYVQETEQEIARVESQVAQGPTLGSGGGGTDYAGPTGLAVGTNSYMGRMSG